jgi:hypothetical protein
MLNAKKIKGIYLPTPNLPTLLLNLTYVPKY